MRTGRLRLLVALLVAVGLLAVGCGSDDDGTGTGTTAGDRTDGTVGPAGTGEPTGGADGAGSEGASDAEGVPWVLDVSASSAPSGTLPTGTVNLRLDDGELSGSDGCNQVTGAYALSGDRLTVEPLGRTMMACHPPEVMDQADRYVAALEEGGTVVVADESLTITTAGGATLVYAPEPPPAVLEPDELVGTWSMTLEQYSGEGPEASVSASAVGTVTFAEDGTVRAQAACNGFHGTYSAAATSGFTIVLEGWTEKACAQEAMALDDALAGFLDGAANWGGLPGGTIEVLGEDPATRLLLHPEG